MKVRTVLATAFGVGVGYVLGARAGRDRFDELKAQAQRIVSDPDVRQKVADLPNQVRENLPKAQSAVSDAVKGATGKAQSATGRDSSTTTGPSAPVGPTGTGTTTVGTAAADDVTNTFEPPATFASSTTASDSLDPLDPIDPVDAVGTTDAVDPVDPIDLVDPADPVAPIDPIDPTSTRD